MQLKFIRDINDWALFQKVAMPEADFLYFLDHLDEHDLPKEYKDALRRAANIPTKEEKVESKPKRRLVR